jgi:hypothetical protein
VGQGSMAILHTSTKYFLDNLLWEEKRELKFNNNNNNNNNNKINDLLTTLLEAPWGEKAN